MRIGKIAAMTGVPPETIRFYERDGLLKAPGRTAANYRSYGEDDRRRLSFIRRARDLGFSLAQVRELLGLADDRDRPCHAVDEIARQHRGQVSRKLAELTALGRELDNLIAQCSHGNVSECRIIDALAPSTEQVMERQRGTGGQAA